MDGPLAAYLPQDRRQALARGAALPEHAHGAALFADIAGFTPLTEALDRALGARRGVEALTRQINRVYDALIGEIECYGGSVVGFAGDAITCWFNESFEFSVLSSEFDPSDIQNSKLKTQNSPALRATACALMMQRAMRQFAAIAMPDGTTIALSLKVAVASGLAHRFVVGDPAIQLIDVLAGAPLARAAAGEHLTRPGEVLLDQPTATALGDTAAIAAWRGDEETGARFAVIAPTNPSTSLRAGDRRLTTDEQNLRWSVVDGRSSAQLRPWLLPAAYERHQVGLGDFLTELRPVAPLFLWFGGIDYDNDRDAGSKLDAFIRWVQGTLARYDGTLIQLTIGDKGSYLYATFGAPIAHEDDARRAALAALEWRALPHELDFLQPLQIGISRGVLRVGAYGGSTRRSYGAMGDEVNLAARLMAQAAPGEALISGRVQAALAIEFDLEPLEPIPLKGMPEPLPVFRLAGLRRQEVRLPEPTYALPMVGRATELAQIAAKVDLVLAGHGQVLGITAEAGMGKSRLVAEIVRLARRKGLHGYGGACQSYGTNTPYLVWGPIWRAFFDLNPDWPMRKQIRMLAGTVEDLAPDRIAALPLLGSLLGLDLPENDFTCTLEPQFRQSALHALLLDCLRAAARAAAEECSGMLVVLEDLHWIDAASHDLLEQVARVTDQLPILIVVAYRPPKLLRLQAPRVEALAHFSQIALAPLTLAETERIIRAKLAQLLPEHKGAATPVLIARITAKAQGNPFYVEELLNYLRDRGIDPHDTAAIEKLDLPSSLHTLILSRIDQLSAQQQAELKVASVIGRLFQFAWLHGAYPVLGEAAPLKADLGELARLDLTPLDTPEPELAYLFKHIVTQEVAYESLTVQARAALHEQLAAYLEQLAGEETERYLDLLAFHYDRSDNLAKKRAYLRRAGESAAARFANDAAIDYLNRALQLTPDDDLVARYELLLVRERVYDLQGARDNQIHDIGTLEALAEHLNDHRRRAEIAVRRTIYAEHISDFPSATAAAERAIMFGQAAAAPALVAAGYYRSAWALTQQGNYSAARTQAEAGLALARASGDWHGEHDNLHALSFVASLQDDYAAVRSFLAQMQQISVAHGDQSKDWLHHTIRAFVAWIEADYSVAWDSCTQALRIARATGDRFGESFSLGGLGDTARAVGAYTTAKDYSTEALRIAREIGDRQHESLRLSFLGLSAHAQGDDVDTLAASEQALAIARERGDQHTEAVAQLVLGHALLGLGHLHDARVAYEAALAIRRALGQPAMAIEALVGLAKVGLATEDVPRALAYLEEILAGSSTLDGTNEPLHISLTCYQVLRAANDPRALGTLERAHTRLQEQASKITDHAMERSFLENVPYHRAIAAAWAEAQGNIAHG